MLGAHFAKNPVSFPWKEIILWVWHNSFWVPCSSSGGDGVTYFVGKHVSHEKSPPTFHSTGWLIGILIMVYHNPGI